VHPVSELPCAEAALRLLKKYYGNAADLACEIVGSAGSNRTFYRIAPVECEYAHKTTVLMLWDGNDPDWPRCLHIARDLNAAYHCVAKIFDTDKKNGLILQEDLGDCTLNSLCSHGSPELILHAYKEALTALERFSRVGAQQCAEIQNRWMDFDQLLWESSYFCTRCVSDYCRVSIKDENKWQQATHTLAQYVAALPCRAMHRDFQSENMLLHNEKIIFVDYQGARMGPLGYDAASLIYDPYAALYLDEVIIDQLTVFAVSCGVALNRQSMLCCAVQRLMQALGAYGFLFLHKNKTRYEKYILPTLKTLANISKRIPEAEYITVVAEQCVQQLQKPEL